MNWTPEQWMKIGAFLIVGIAIFWTFYEVYANNRAITEAAGERIYNLLYILLTWAITKETNK